MVHDRRPRRHPAPAARRRGRRARAARPGRGRPGQPRAGAPGGRPVDVLGLRRHRALPAAGGGGVGVRGPDAVELGGAARRLRGVARHAGPGLAGVDGV
ncbi:hypothetical protein GB882_06770, partial [Georgenia ruanii]|nr:hypothetical protein [Georgenia ruanii]